MSQHPTPKTVYLTPLDVVECLVAEMRQLGRIVGTHPKSPYGWRRGSSWRDDGDMPPPVNRRVLAYAARHDLPLTAEHLIWGGEWSEIEALARSIGRAMPVHLREKYFPPHAKVAAE